MQVTSNKLTFENVRLQEDGVYQCVAENKFGMIVSSTWVNVLGNLFTNHRGDTGGAIHSTKISGNFGLKLNGSVRSNWKSYEEIRPPFKVDHFSQLDWSI